MPLILQFNEYFCYELRPETAIGSLPAKGVLSASATRLEPFSSDRG
jgi:hypothetical protein